MHRLPSRRQFLQTLASGLSVGVAGCSKNGDMSSPATGTTQSPTTRLTPTVSPTQTTTSVRSTPVTPQQEASGAITATANETFGTFGTAVAVDGETALVGATNGSDGGAVLVFERNGVWQRTATLRPEEASDVFGSAVDISGNVAVVGDRFADRGDRHNGVAYIYERGSDGWRQAVTIGPPSDRGDDELFDGIGWSVAVANETVIVSAQRTQSTMRSEVGSVQLFRRTDDGWKRSETFTSRRKGFGWAVTLPTPDRAAVGIPRAETSDGTGQVILFDETSDGWTKTAALSTSGNDQFGSTLAGDNTTLVVGTRSTSSETNGARVYVYELVSGTWTRTQLDLTEVHSSTISAAIADDIVVVGAPARNDKQGQAFIFERSSGSWSRQSRLGVDDATAAFGRTVDTTDTITLVAAPDDTSGEQRGAVYVFTP